MKSIDEIMRDYTSGRASIEDTNAELKAAQNGFFMEYHYHEFTEKEQLETTVGCCPENVNGWGIIETMSGLVWKSRVVNGCLRFVIHSDNPYDSVGTFHICGMTYGFNGEKLCVEGQQELNLISEKH